MCKRIAAFCALVICSTTLAEPPFEDMTYSQALAKAKETNKVVMIDFYTTWCPPCKMLDAMTWPDEKVRAWLGEHAVCMKVNAETSREFAARFKVRGYPTIVFIKPDETVLDRIVGFLGPKDFIDAAKGALSGKDALTRAREAFEAGDANDPMHRDDYARKLVKLGKPEEALGHYLWCFDEGARHDPAYAGVRVSFLLVSIHELGSTYPPAIDALKMRRDRSEDHVRQFIGGKKLKARKSKAKGVMGLLSRVAGVETPRVAEAANDVAALNDTLGESERTIKIYDELTRCDREHADTARRMMFYRIRDQILEARRYEDYVRDGDPTEMSANAIENFNFTSAMDAKRDPDMAKMLINSMRMYAIGESCKCYEACVGADRLELAEQIRKKLIAFDASYATFDSLIAAAVRAKRYDVLQTLADDAATKLPKEDADAVAETVKSHLSTTEAKAELERRKSAESRKEVGADRDESVKNE